METRWIILAFMGILLLIVMIYIFIKNNKDRKEYERELNARSYHYEDDSEVNDIQ